MTEIVHVGLQDVPKLADLREASGRETGEDAIRQDGWRERFVHYLRARQEAGELQCFAARDDGQVIGMAIASLVSDYRFAVFGERRGYVNAVFVAPQCRARGIGRALTDAAVAWLSARGCVTVRLRPSAKAKPLYRRMGFTESGELALDLG